MRIQLLLVIISVLKAVGQDVPAGCTLDTSTGYRYSNFNHAATDGDGGILVKFKVRAKSDAHIVLSSSALALNPLYEVVLGAAGNTYTDVRRTMTGKSVAAAKTPQVLSENDYRGFWITFKNGELEVGREGETMPFLHWKDKDPLNVHYYAFATWTGVIGKWLHRCPGTDAAAIQNDEVPDTPEVFNAIQRLHNDLIKPTYNAAIRPVSNHSHSVTVSIGMSFLHFDLDEFGSVFHFNGWTQLAWRDERLSWNETLYEGLQLLHVSIMDIWKPDISLYNSAEMEMMQNTMAATHALVYSDGSILWVAPTRYNAICKLDFRYWPWDTQTCFLKLGSWSHDGEKLDLTLAGNVSAVSSIAGSELYSANPRWELISTRAERQVNKYECCPEPYPEISFFVTFKRRSPMFSNTIVLPAVVLVSLTLFTLWLPPNGSEKFTITLVNIFLLILYMMYFGFEVPAMIDHQPAIVSFYGGTLVLVTLSMLFSIITLRMTRLPNPNGIPHVFKRLITGSVGTALCLGWAGNLMSSTHKPLTNTGDRAKLENGSLTENDGQTEPELIECGTELEWTLLAIFIDRVLFLLYCAIFGIMMAACF